MVPIYICVGIFLFVNTIMCKGCLNKHNNQTPYEEINQQFVIADEDELESLLPESNKENIVEDYYCV